MKNLKLSMVTLLAINSLLNAGGDLIPVVEVPDEVISDYEYKDEYIAPKPKPIIEYIAPKPAPVVEEYVAPAPVVEDYVAPAPEHVFDVYDE